jgi:hypothetical protein
LGHPRHGGLPRRRAVPEVPAVGEPVAVRVGAARGVEGHPQRAVPPGGATASDAAGGRFAAPAGAVMTRTSPPPS